MSLKRRFKRASALRSVSVDEGPFRATISCHAAFVEAGILPREVQIGFLPDAEKQGICHPAVVIQNTRGACTYRLDNISIEGSQEDIEKRWRAWVASLAADPDNFAKARRTMYEKSEFFGKKHDIRAYLRREGLMT